MPSRAATGRRSTRVATGGGLALLLAACGCGSESEVAADRGATRSMAAVHREAASEPTAPSPGESALARAQAEPSLAPAERPEANRPPRLRGIQVDPAPRVAAGQDVVVVADAEDPEGDAIELFYDWFVNGARVDAEGPRFATTALRRGDEVRVRVTASDGRAESAPLESPALRVENGLPEILSRPEAPGPDGAFRYQVVARDRDGGGTLRYALAEAPRGMRIHPVRGLVEWAPRPDQAGIHPVEIHVLDARGATARQRFDLTIGAAPAAQGS